MSERSGFLHKLTNEPHYMIGAAVTGGLVIMTSIVFVTTNESNPHAAKGDVDWSDNAGRTNAFQSENSLANASSPAMKSFFAKRNDPRNQTDGSMDSTQLLIAGEDPDFDMNNSGMKGVKKATGLKGQGTTTLAKMEELGLAKEKTQASLTDAANKASDIIDGSETTEAEDAVPKLGKIDQLKRAFSGSSKGSGKSLFAGFDMFRGFGNKDEKKSEGSDRDSHSGDKKERDFRRCRKWTGEY
jgi:hypothetical protein